MKEIKDFTYKNREILFSNKNEVNNPHDTEEQTGIVGLQDSEREAGNWLCTLRISSVCLRVE